MSSENKDVSIEASLTERKADDNTDHVVAVEAKTEAGQSIRSELAEQKVVLDTFDGICSQFAQSLDAFGEGPPWEFMHHDTIEATSKTLD